MQLLHAWRDSLSLLAPSNLKLFLMVSLKSVIEAYKVFFKNWWWWVFGLFGALLIIIGLAFFELTGYSKVARSIFFVLIAIFNLFSWGIFVLAARPSVAIKNYTYFKHYFWPLLLVVVMWAILLVSSTSLTVFLATNNYILQIILFVLSGHISLLTFLWTFFWFDSDKRPRSAWISFTRALEMFVYNYPLFIIFFITYFIGIILLVLLSYLIWPVDFISHFFINSVAICLLMNLYIKKLHEQPDLYFNQPS
jgi:hypothetical protein